MSVRPLRTPKPKGPKAPLSLPTIIIDTREQQPYPFDAARCAMVTRTLKTGDYSVDGLEDLVSIERKNRDDFVRSVTGERDRFFRCATRLSAIRKLRCVIPLPDRTATRHRFFACLERMRSMPFARLVVECTIDDIQAGRYTSKAHPSSILGTAIAIDSAYVPIVWAGDRVNARDYVERVLLRIAQKGIAALQESAASEANGEPA